MVGLRRIVASISILVSSSFAIPAGAQSTSENDPNANGRAATVGVGVRHTAPSLVGETRPVYRGSAKPPQEVFRDGWDSLGSNPNVMDHALGKKRDSLYVPTSVDYAVAARFAASKKDGKVFLIQENGQAVDVNAVLGKDSPYATEAELAWPKGVPGRAVEGVWITKDGEAKWIPNPEFRPLIPSINSDPVLAKDQLGRFYDARNGKLLTDEQIADAKDRADAYRVPGGITLLRETRSGAIGLSAGPFTDGRANIVRGSLGEVNVDVARLEGSADGRVRLVNGGVDASVTLKAQATLVGLQASTGILTLGDPDSMTYATGSATANAFVGAEALADANVALTRQKVAASGRVSAFVGAKAQGDVAGSIVICGVSIGATGHGEVSYGLGGSAEGYFKVDWSTMTVKIGGRAALTAGLGAGAGGEVEISLEKLMKDPSMAGKCALDALSKTAKAGLDALANGVDAVSGTLAKAGRKLCFWCKDEEPPHATVAAADGGYNGTRGAPTATPPRGATSIRTTRSADGAGLLRN